MTDMESIITFQVVETGTERGKRKIVSSNGYSFTWKRELKNGTVEWRCSVRGKQTCHVAVKQQGNDFYPTHQQHLHPAKPGLLTAVKIKSELKSMARAEIFETAHNMVTSVGDIHNDAQQPEASRPNPATLVRITNRTRSTIRPKDPEDMSFQLNEDYLRQTIPEMFFRTETSVGTRRHLLFATANQLQLLSKANTWYIDGTFKVVKAPFYQLLSIHSFVKSGEDMKQLPLCFCVMSGKKSRDYKKVFQSVLDSLPSPP